MKKITIVILLLSFQISVSQSIKYRSVSAGVSQKVNGKFSFPEYQKDQTVVVLNTATNSLILYGKSERTYDIYDTADKMTLSNGDNVMEFYAIDPESKKCLIRFIVFATKSEKTNVENQLYIIYDNYQLVFNLI